MRFGKFPKEPGLAKYFSGTGLDRDELLGTLKPARRHRLFASRDRTLRPDCTVGGLAAVKRYGLSPRVRPHKRHLFTVWVVTKVLTQPLTTMVC